MYPDMALPVQGSSMPSHPKRKFTACARMGGTCLGASFNLPPGWIGPSKTICRWSTLRYCPLLVLVAIVSVQFGSALATTLFEEVGPAGTVFYRHAVRALLLLAIWRLQVKHDREAWKLAVIFGIALAAMNLFFYACSTGSRWAPRSPSSSSAR